MVFFAKRIHETLGSPTIVVLTDRNDLDEQLFGQFAKCAGFLRQTPIMAENRAHLRRLLEGRQTNGIFFSTIQKFEESEEPLTDRSDVIVLADEAHRSHYGLIDRMTTKRNDEGELIVKRHVGCARIIRSSLPKATYLAFTGTPIEDEDRSTREVFGDYIDIYAMGQAVLDGATKPIFYESRVAKLQLNDEVLARIDAEYERLKKEDKATDETISRSKSELSRLEVLLGHEQTIAALASDIIAHYEDCRAGLLTGKAMIVAYSRPIAVKLYREILHQRPAWGEKVKVVMTESNQDPEDWHELTGTKETRQKLAVAFKDNANAFKIAIVVDMWLTGFDLPSLATMYVYKPMVGHNLTQAMARVNRVFGQKEGGLIVDYIGIAGDIKEAMSRYGGAKKAGGVSGGDIRETAYAQFVENLEICRDQLHGYDYRSCLDGTPLEQGRNVTEGLNFLLANERKEKREIFLEHAAKMGKAEQLCRSVVGEGERAEAAYMGALRIQIVRVLTGGGGGKVSLDGVNERIETMIRESVSATGIMNIFSDEGEKVSVFSPKFLAEIEKMKERNLAMEMLKNLLKKQLAKYRKTNIVKSEKFSEKMHGTLNAYINGHISNEKVIQELLALAKEIAESQDEARRMGFSDEEAAFYSALTRPKAVKEFYTNETLKAMTKELTAALQRNRTVDWTMRNSARAQMRLMVRRLLRKYKYPPEEAEGALEGVLSQAELWADNGEN